MTSYQWVTFIISILMLVSGFVLGWIGRAKWEADHDR
jgi:hypothetical protein